MRVEVGLKAPPIVRPPATTTARERRRAARSPRPAPAPAPAPAPKVDPRLAARRVAVRRGEGRRRLRRMALIGGIAALVAGAYGVTRTPLLDVDHIEIEGAGQTPVAELLTAAAHTGVSRGEPLLDVETGAAAEAIEALPWVADAAVGREGLARITVTVRERTAVAVAAVPSGGWAVLAADGVVVAVAPAWPAGLVEVRGLAEVGEPGTRVEAGTPVAVAAALPETVRDAVAAIEPGPDADSPADLLLHDGGRVLLGPPDHLEAKLDAVATMLARVDLTGLATLDVRVPETPVLTRM